MKSIGQIISHYRKEAGLSQIALSKKLKDLGVEVSSKSISAWEHGRSEPSVETFLYICRILGIWDCIEVCFGSNPGDPLSVLNVDGKDMVISFIEMLRHSSQYLKPEHAPTNVSAALAPAATRHLRLYNVTASTGTGSFLDSDSYTTLEGDVKKAGSADCSVTMSDDSMEPLFHSHEMVLVHQQDTLEDGDIGIFALNGSICIRKFKSDRSGVSLVSPTPKYRPIPIRPGIDSFRIFGKVLPRK